MQEDLGEDQMNQSPGLRNPYNDVMMGNDSCSEEADYNQLNYNKIPYIKASKSSNKILDLNKIIKENGGRH